LRTWGSIGFGELGGEQWSVASGQLKRQFFSWANFEKCTFFEIRMFRFGWLLVGDGSSG
jgi:hypothetical protein